MSCIPVMASIEARRTRFSASARPRALVVALTLVLLTLIVAGCRTTVDVSIVADDSGGGVVTATLVIDKEALGVLGGEDAFSFDDLTDTAWAVPTGSPTEEGGYRLVAERTFTDAADLQDGLDELAGEGVFTNTELSVTHGFARSDAELSVDVSVTGDPAQFSDEALTKVLGGLPIGYTPEELLLVSGGKEPEATMKVSVDVPGGERSEQDFDLTSGVAQSHTVSSRGSDRNTGVVILGAVGLVIMLMGLATLVFALVARRRT